MKGYLSRIASQTGLRFSPQGAVPPRVADETPAETSPTPLDCEETVMAPPSGETKRADAGALKSGLTRERRVAEAAAPKPDPSKTLARTVRKKASAGSVPETLAAAALETTVPVEPGLAKPIKMEALSSDESLVSHAAETEPTEIVKTVYGNGSAIKEKHENHTQAPGKNAPTAPKEAEKRTEKHHFSQTAEVIGGRHAEPVEVQTILLRELQEWVAAGHTAEAGPRAEADRSIESVALGAEPGSVRIGQKRHRGSIPKEASRIEEQSFDLSIGTISVVIEGDEHLPQRASAPRAENPPSGQDRGRGRSRLGRNYL
jgi:hypothetical protein